MARSIKPPADLGPRGAALWRNCLKRDDSLADSENPMREMVLEAARQADHLDALQKVCDEQGVMVYSDQGVKVHPALVELNKARSLMARLIVSLRLPDEATGKKPQRRGMTSSRKPQAAGGRAGSVTSLDRARRAAGGA